MNFSICDKNSKRLTKNFIFFLHNQLSIDIRVPIQVRIVSFRYRFFCFEIRLHSDIINFLWISSRVLPSLDEFGFDVYKPKNIQRLMYLKQVWRFVSKVTLLTDSVWICWVQTKNNHITKSNHITRFDLDSILMYRNLKIFK